MHKGRFASDIRKYFSTARTASTVTAFLKSLRSLHHWKPLRTRGQTSAAWLGQHWSWPGAEEWTTRLPHIPSSSDACQAIFFFPSNFTEEEGNCSQPLKMQNFYSFYATKHSVNKSNYVYDLLMAPLMS